MNTSSSNHDGGFDQNMVIAASLIVFSELMFASMGASIKSLDGRLDNEMVVFLRNLLGLVLLAPWLLHSASGGIRTERFGLHLFRSLAGLAAMYSLFYAVANIELAQALILKMTSPFFIPIIALLWLGEAIPKVVRWAILVGFVGVFMIVRPNLEGVDPVMWIALMGGAFAGLAKVTVRRLSSTEPGSRIVFYFALIATTVSAIPAAWRWQTPAPELWPWLIAIGVFATLGQLTMTRAYRMAPAGKVGAFTYASVIFGAAYGYLFWGESLDWLDVAGAALIFLAGFMITRSKRMVLPGPTSVR